MFQELRASLTLLILLTLLTGIAYPLTMTGLGQSLFPHQANGSLVEQDGKIIGSELIGQNFTGDTYFHPRPSAAGSGYDAENSSGSNLAPTAPSLLKTLEERATELRKTGDQRPIPVDLITTSGSGLDPDISVAAALFQAPRIAQTRNLSAQQVQELITQNTTSRRFDILGENRVNVLKINQALDLIPPTSIP